MTFAKINGFQLIDHWISISKLIEICVITND